MRSLVIALMILGLACSRGGEDWKLPAQLEGGWRLVVAMPGKETFELIRVMPAKRSLMGGYEGPEGKIVVVALEMGPSAFEQVQKWRASEGKVVFHHGPYFVVVEGTGLSVRQFSAAASALEKTMP